ncbi:helix-turn-helix transcriptional regulator [Azospirillum agricola]|uniref:helix-turn-helix transcriptional regulator n=1 Tax=Azospirillum agricola TaxID=1720247 RepID=UPI000A0EF1BB|nr:autoinducer binding domain-containing protein [Azospirillum agricola]SMH60744.1 regulatory protein, luxR family [Azospirillum lipoferum]
MTRPPHANKVLGAAIEDFRRATSFDELWAALHRHLEGFGILRVMYGSKASLLAPQLTNIYRCSYAKDYLREKEKEGLAADYCVQAVQRERTPILWSDTQRIAEITQEATRRSLAIDWKYGVMTGVSLPFRFNDNLSGGGFGLHAPNMGWSEFDRIWQEHAATIQAICRAFDIQVRKSWASTLIPLSDLEKECLRRLGAGYQAKQIAHQLGISAKAVGRQTDKARDTLKASNATQAVMNAMAYKLIPA